jgi:hypothetical protein
MTGKPVTIEETLGWLDEGIKHTRASIRWQIAARAVVGDDTTAWRRAVTLAVLHDEQAREALNRVRVELGGEPEPDPADPPPVRPDD